MKHTSMLAITCALLGGGAFYACSHSVETAESPGAQPARVRVVAVHRGEISDVLTVSGETAALTVLRLASPVAGKITMLTARPGDHLAKDEVAAQVISFENEAALRGFTVLEEAGRTTPEERQLAQHLRKDLHTRNVALRVPFAALVAERLHNPGELVAQNDVLLELFDPQSLYVMAQVPAEVAELVHPALPVEVEFAAQTLHGEVAALIAALTPQTLTVPVRITLQGSPQPALLHAAVRCRIQLAHDPRALLIPVSALISSQVERHGVVMVAVDGHAQRRAVELGMQSPAHIEVLHGLSDGELVLAEGQYALPDGTPVEAVQGASE
jgi:multidrug efflux pump subunit AcrA (membrane-fusion protein)